MTRHGIITLAASGLLVVVATLLMIVPNKADAHCQVPCGIFDDPARISRLKEDASTIAKAITKINQLAGSHDATAFNQAARWVATKEDHASHIITVVAEYFLTQRVKPVARGADGYDEYLHMLADHHAVMVAAIKTKQSSNPDTITGLNMAIERLGKHYSP